MRNGYQEAINFLNDTLVIFVKMDEHMPMEHSEEMGEGVDMEHDGKMEPAMEKEKMPAMEHESHIPAAETIQTDHASMHHGQTSAKDHLARDSQIPGMGMFAEYNYDFLQVPATTAMFKTSVKFGC